MPCYKKVHLIANELMSFDNPDQMDEGLEYEFKYYSYQDWRYHVECLARDIREAKRLGLQLRSEIYRLEQEEDT